VSSVLRQPPNAGLLEAAGLRRQPKADTAAHAHLGLDGASNAGREDAASVHTYDLIRFSPRKHEMLKMLYLVVALFRYDNSHFISF